MVIDKDEEEKKKKVIWKLGPHLVNKCCFVC